MFEQIQAFFFAMDRCLNAMGMGYDWSEVERLYDWAELWHTRITQKFTSRGKFHVALHYQRQYNKFMAAYYNELTAGE